MQLGDFPASHSHTHTHDIAIFFGFEKTIMKFNKLGMSSARLENVLVAPLQDCLQEMFFILALLTIVNQFRELPQSIEFDTQHHQCLVS